MPFLKYKTQVAEDGSVTLPLVPEYRDRKVVVSVNEPPDPSETGSQITHDDLFMKIDEEFHDLKRKLLSAYMDLCDEIASLENLFHQNAKRKSFDLEEDH